MRHGTAAARLPMGAEIEEGGVRFRVWAPARRRVEAVLEAGPGAGTVVALEAGEGGWFSGRADGAGAGTRYRFRLDGGASFPDPASRFQPEGVHGPSEVIDPAAFRWTDDGWRGVTLPGQVLYELHVGTFTREGTWAAAAARLPALAELGITCVEVMPVAAFDGRFGWGYDGVDWFAPYAGYGPPDAMRAFVDRAHALGIGVVLDVVYNHFGPAGCYVREFGDAWFSDRHATEWGEALNFDGPESAAVRAFVIANAAFWVREYHVDGLRLDATQSVFDASSPHVLREITEAVREAAGGRGTLVVAENEPQHAGLVRPPARGGMGMDAVWNDDFHHTAHVALTGRTEAYYTDYRGTPQELISAVRRGFLYQGQRYAWQGKRRGLPAGDVAAPAYVLYLQNHDQIANSGRGWRVDRLAAPGTLRAMTALLLLAPGTPMLFMGQEWAASAPFLYFADHEPALAATVREGRRAFVGQFPSVATEAMRALVPDPADPATFAASALDWDERERPHHAAWLALHRDLLRLRRVTPAIAAQRADRVEGAVLGAECFVLRFPGDAEDGADDRLLLVNLGRDGEMTPAPEPLLAPPAGMRWTTAWSSEHPDYGGQGMPDPETEDGGWRMTGQAAALLAPAPRDDHDTDDDEEAATP